MALKNQPQDATPTPEQVAAQTEQPAATAEATTETTPVVEDQTSTEAAGTVPAPEEQAPAPQDAPAPTTQDAPAPEETGEQSEAVQEEQSASDVPLVLLGTRKGFPSTAVGNFNLISDVVTELYNKGVLVINVDGDESSVFFDPSKL